MILVHIDKMGIATYQLEYDGIHREGFDNSLQARYIPGGPTPDSLRVGIEHPNS